MCCVVLVPDVQRSVHLIRFFLRSDAEVCAVRRWREISFSYVLVDAFCWAGVLCSQMSGDLVTLCVSGSVLLARCSTLFPAIWRSRHVMCLWQPSPGKVCPVPRCLDISSLYASLDASSCHGVLCSQMSVDLVTLCVSASVLLAR